MERLEATSRASSANYLLADRSGQSSTSRRAPAMCPHLHRIEPDDRGVVLHTNHFVSPDFDSVDYADYSVSTSRERLDRITEFVDAADGPSVMARFAAALTDHTDEPDSVCRHPDETLPEPEQIMTVASILVDLTEQRVRARRRPSVRTRVRGPRLLLALDLTAAVVPRSADVSCSRWCCRSPRRRSRSRPGASSCRRSCTAARRPRCR